ncbi:MAG: class I SAM-dependent RNA methyltransferase [Bdellovibrio sp.]|nr:class I SAM-dependent RNA methyltransferase [Bdellovibrio sp.]
MSTNMSCTYFPACQGCKHWNLSYAEQKKLKIATLSGLLDAENISHPAIEFISCGEYGLRHRLDFTIQNEQIQQMGFYDQAKNLIDIKQCLQLSPELQSFFSQFRQVHFPIKKGSARLRIGPSGQRGCWLDFSNLDIKNLLAEKSILINLLEKNIHIEVGQKGKKVSIVGGILRLTDPEPHAWFESYTADLQKIPIFGLVSDFTQPSWFSAKKMIEILLGWTDSKSSETTAIEFGPGLGQFTLPLLSKGFHVEVFESDESATEYLKLNAEKSSLSKNLKINLGDFQNKSIANQQPVDFAVVNPPRSGLKKFTHEVIRTQAKSCIYISCFPESMAQDLKILAASGYQIKDIKIVDQFPQTSHFESCVLLEKLF